MSMKPMLFNTDMVRAILDGRKTVTRRVVKPQPNKTASFVTDNLLPETVEAGAGGVYLFSDGTATHAPCQSGDILYVRETFTIYQTVNYVRKYDGRAFSEVSDGRYAYKADGYESIEDLRDDIRLLSDCGLEAVEIWEERWHPSIHMPKEAARIFLRVTNVWVERLRDITDEQVKAEGANPKEWFSDVWDSIIKPADRATYGWTANPWVWVIEFERISRKEALKNV